MQLLISVLFQNETVSSCTLATNAIFCYLTPTFFMQVNNISVYLPGRIVFFLVKSQVSC
jgi:hypothetical protein